MPTEHILWLFALSVAACVAMGLIYGIRVLATYVKSKTHNQFVGYMMSVVETLAEKVVSDVYQGYVSPLKASGSFDKASQQVALQKALDALKSYLGADGLGKLATVLGQGASTDQFIATQIEDAVVKAKPPVAIALEGPPMEAAPGIVLDKSMGPN